jgi:hypothetical protein
MNQPTMPLKRRIALCAAVAVVAGAWSAVLHLREGSDFDVVVRGAAAWLGGGDPFELRGHYFPLLYPFTAVLFAVPFSFLPYPDFWFVGLGVALFAWAATSQPRLHWSLMVLASPAMLQLFHLAQWSALLTAAALLPSVGFLLACKPSVGAALWCAFPTRRTAVGVLVFTAASLALFPSWPWRWLAQVQTAFHVQAPITFWGGPLVLLALYYWRTWEARLLVALACVPQSGFYYDIWPLFLIPRRVEEAVYLLIASWFFVPAGID